MKIKRWIAGVVVGGVIGGILSWGGQVAAVSSPWLTHPVENLHEVSMDMSVLGHCSGVLQPIKVSGWPMYKEACVQGEPGKPRLARYMGNTNTYLYAFSGPFDEQFYALGNLCSSVVACLYGQSADTLLARVQGPFGLQLAMITDFSKQLTKQSGNGGTYLFNQAKGWEYIKIGSQATNVNAFAVSPGGAWGLVELTGYGFVRINLSTLEYRRVVAPGAEYSGGYAPFYELAITRDGSHVAISEWREGVRVFMVGDDCGDILTSQSQFVFSAQTYSCPQALLQNRTLLPDFTGVYYPQFSDDGLRLSVYKTALPGTKLVTLGPRQIDTSAMSFYSALGDSFTSGEGELRDEFYLPHTNTTQNRCHVSTRSYPYLVGEWWGIPTENKACSGARIAQVKGASTGISQSSHISVSVGGNDTGLMSKLKTCLGPGTCEWASVKLRRASMLEIQQLFSPLVDLLQTIKRNQPAGKVAVVGYPRVINSREDAQCTTLVSTLLNHDERVYMDESIIYLNKVLRAAARYVNVSYVDVEQVFSGQRLCDASTAAMNSIRLGDDIAPLSFLKQIKIIGAESFHPTPTGHQLVARAVTQAGRHWEGGECRGCVFDDSLLSPAPYWEVDTARYPLVPQKLYNFLSDVETKARDIISFQFPMGTFQPSTAVRLELHSDTHVLAEEVTAEDGSVSGEVTLPNTSPGYHTVHTFGTTLAGELIDLYQVIFVGDKDSQPGLVGEGSGDKAAPRLSVSLVKKPLEPNSPHAATLGVASQLSPLQFSTTSPSLPISTTRPSPPRAQTKSTMRIIGMSGVLLVVGMVILWWLIARRSANTSDTLKPQV